MTTKQKSVKIVTTLFDVRYVNDDPIAFPDGYYMSNEVEFDIPLESKEWELDSNWNWIMLCVERIAKRENKTISNVLHYLTINSNFNSIKDLFEAVFNYLTEK